MYNGRTIQLFESTIIILQSRLLQYKCKFSSNFYYICRLTSVLLIAE